MTRGRSERRSGGVGLAEPEVAAWIKESIDEEFKPILEVS